MAFLIDKNLMVEPALRALEVKAEPFSLESLIAWLETKPADEVYCYLDNGKCLVGRYLTEVCGYSTPNVGPDGFNELGHPESNVLMPPHWDAIAYGTYAGAQSHLWRVWTFGAALERARAYQAKR